MSKRVNYVVPQNIFKNAQLLAIMQQQTQSIVLQNDAIDSNYETRNAQ